MSVQTTTTTMTVPPAPAYGMRARIARRLVTQVIRGTEVAVRLPNGSVIGGCHEIAERDRTGRDRAGQGEGSCPRVEVARPQAFFARVGADPKVGLGESFMAGDWRIAQGSDLAEMMARFPARFTTMLPAPVLALRRLVVDRAIPEAQRNTVSGSRANIAAHYDLSNDHFASFLDETMTYSAALFDESQDFAGQDLAEAQHRKIDAILDAAHVGPGTNLLEIGTGWGELALRAGQRGARVTTITLSAEQRALAQHRIDDAGLSESVEVRLQDYREVQGSFDAIVSVEMIEAVGEEFWPTYFRTIDRLLAPGGTAAIQSIIMSHDRMLINTRSFGWIQKYIFPGGLIPSLRAIDEVNAAHTSLRVTQVHTFGLHYAETLRRWRLRFLENWPQVETLGFDETFRRMWEFYLAYCEAGFATGYLDVAHLTLRRQS